MYRLIPTLALLLTASGSQAAMTASPSAITPVQTLNPALSLQSSALTAPHLERRTDASLQLAQGPRGPGDWPRDYRGPGGYGDPGPYGYGPGYGPDGRRGPGYYPGPGPRPRPAPPPDPGPAGIIPHILPLFLPPPR